MSRTTMRKALVLTDEQRIKLVGLSNSRTLPIREVERARIILGYEKGYSISSLSQQIGVTRTTIYKWIDKALATGVEQGLKDAYHRPHPPEISDEAKAWVVSIACTKPKDHGLAAEVWTLSQLALYVREHAIVAGYPRISNADKKMMWRILNEHDIKPHKIKYYLEKKDPDFDRKMQEVLMIYKEVSIYSQSQIPKGRTKPVYTVSIDEKPGIQALSSVSPDLSPVPHKHPSVGRDYEYIRHGTVSLLAGIDLHTGHIFQKVEDRHRSIEFIGLLKEIDAYYPDDATIRIILDNHSAHISKETMAYLSTQPRRFEYVHTPVHGSWLNLIECVFSKCSRTFLKHIRVDSIEDLKSRIAKGIDEFNDAPVIFKWNKFDLGLV